MTGSLTGVSGLGGRRKTPISAGKKKCGRCGQWRVSLSSSTHKDHPPFCSTCWKKEQAKLSQVSKQKND